MLVENREVYYAWGGIAVGIIFAGLSGVFEDSFLGSVFVGLHFLPFMAGVGFLAKIKGYAPIVGIICGLFSLVGLLVLLLLGSKETEENDYFYSEDE